MEDETVDGIADDEVEQEENGSPLFDKGLELALPDYEGHPVAEVSTKISGTLESMLRAIDWHETGFVLIEWRCAGVNHTGDPLKRVQSLEVKGATEVSAADAEPILARARAIAVKKADEARGHRSLGNELDDTVQVVTSADGVVMTAAEIAEARGEVMPAEKSFAVIFADGSRGIWPDAWLGLGQSLAAPGGSMRLPESTELGKVGQVVKWLDLESGDALAEWTAADEEARLVDLENELARAEAKADRETVEAMPRPAGVKVKVEPEVKVEGNVLGAPWPDFDELDRYDVIDAIGSVLDPAVLSALMIYEAAGKGRKTVLAAASKKKAELELEGDES